MIPILDKYTVINGVVVSLDDDKNKKEKIKEIHEQKKEERERF